MNMLINVYCTGDVGVDWKIIMKWISQNSTVGRGLDLLSSSGGKLTEYR
jgi:hypothetical protein